MDTIIRETVHTCIEYLPKLIEASERSSKYLRKVGMEQQAMELLSQIFEGLQWVISALVKMQSLGFVTAINHQELDMYLHEMNNALQVQDYTLVADLLLYEIKPVLEMWLSQMASYK